MIKKFTAIILIFLITSTPVFAAETVKGYINEPFSVEDVPQFVEFMISEPLELEETVIIPSGAIVNAQLFNYQKERRWHKSGFFICKLMSYTLQTAVPVDISKKDFYLIVRKREKINGKEAAITGTELVLSAAASIIVPGIDIVYFFTKGAIQREKHHNWFKAGVSNAYDNSICWFWLKGRPIELDGGDAINLKEIDKNKAKKLGIKIDKRHKKESLKADKKAFKLAQKRRKEELKENHKLEKEALEKALEEDYTEEQTD